jgi:hypothetical protein
VLGTPLATTETRYQPFGNSSIELETTEKPLAGALVTLTTGLAPDIVSCIPAYCIADDAKPMVKYGAALDVGFFIKTDIVLVPVPAPVRLD